jgi:hypothetical protein
MPLATSASAPSGKKAKKKAKKDPAAPQAAPLVPPAPAVPPGYPPGFPPGLPPAAPPAPNHNLVNLVGIIGGAPHDGAVTQAEMAAFSAANKDANGKPQMRATWDLLTRPDGLSVRALRNLFVQAHGEPSPMWFSVIVDSGWFELFAPTRLPLAPLVLEAEGAIFTCLERVAHVRIVDCKRPGPLGNPFPTLRKMCAQICATLAACPRQNS